MKGLRVHAILLALALVGAYQTWSRDYVSDEDRARVLLWEHDTTAVAAIHYRSTDREVLIEQRRDESGPYLWGVVTEGGMEPSEFPVGATGNMLIGGWAALRAERDLGVPAAERLERYGLASSQTVLHLDFGEVQKEVVVGKETYGGSNRYALDREAGTAFVIPEDLVVPFEIGEGSLRERWLHHYSETLVSAVRVLGGDVERVMEKQGPSDWAPPGSDTPDATFANFIQRVGQLAIAGYPPVPDESGLVPLLRVEYLDGDGATLGFVELLKDPVRATDPYFVRSERTRVLAGAVTALAERVEQDVADVF